LAHPKVGKAVKRRLRALYRTLDPVALLPEIRATPEHSCRPGGRMALTEQKDSSTRKREEKAISSLTATRN